METKSYMGALARGQKIIRYEHSIGKISLRVPFARFRQKKTTKKNGPCYEASKAPVFVCPEEAIYFLERAKNFILNPLPPSEAVRKHKNLF